MMNYDEKSRCVVMDFLWSLFIAAMQTYRYDFLLRPFPNKYVKKSAEEKDIDRLRQDASRIPSMDIFLKNESLGVLPAESEDLFNWFVSSQNFILQPLKKEYFSHIQQFTGQTLPASLPDYIFKVIAPHKHQLKFDSSKKVYGSFYAYHGSRLENFYSILHNGLASHLCKTGLFGSGVYLSSELSLSLLYSPSGRGWDRSIFGVLLSCVAVCEVINHPSINHKIKDDSDYTVPEKYFVVQNNDLLKVNYLLLYTNAETNRTMRENCWWKKNKLVIASILYVIVLIIIGIHSSNYYSVWRKYFS